jgi:hypothetical protein
MTAIKAPATMPIIMAVFSAASELIRSRMRLFLSGGIQETFMNLKGMNRESYPSSKLGHTFQLSILLHFLAFLMLCLVPQNVQDVGGGADADPRRWMRWRCDWRETTVASGRRSGGWRKDRGGGGRRRGCAQRSLRNQIGPGRNSRRGIGI